MSDIGDERAAKGLFLFLAYAHDIGKATPAFQLKGSRSDADAALYEKARMAGADFGRAREFADSHAVPHALATQLILESMGCRRDVAVVAGAHHGKPPSYETLNRVRPETYPESFGVRLSGWADAWRELTEEALAAGGFPSLDALPRISEPVQVLLCGLLIMADWLASNTAYFPCIGLDEDVPDPIARARTGVRALPVPLTFPPENDWETEGFFRERFGFEPFPLQQAAMSIAGTLTAPGMIVIEAAMGSGKTEAALAAAEIMANRFGCNGLFFALPTQATSNAIFSRILQWTRSMNLSGRHAIRLAHGKAQFHEEYSSLFAGGENIDGGNDTEVEQWFEGSKKSLLADYVVGTVDQLLFAALRQKHVMLRHLGLAGKVVIIDECHAYDAYMNQYLFRALRWLGAYRVPVVVLSATLPRVKREALISEYMGRSVGRKPRDPLANPSSAVSRDPLANPSSAVSRDPLANPSSAVSRDPLAAPPAAILPDASAECGVLYPVITVSDNGAIRTTPVDGGDLSREVEIDRVRESELDAFLAGVSDHPGYVGILVNTVARAQSLAARLRKAYGAETVTLIHSRYLPEDRAATEDRLARDMGRNGPPRERFRIVVGTQVLEQSLDIDFDLLLTELCPMDLLLQRIGRLQRHRIARDSAYRRARCCVLLTDEGKYDNGSRAVYGDYLLMRTRELLPDIVRIPASIPELVQAVYGGAPDAPGFEKAYEDYTLAIRKKEERARAFRVTAPEPNANIVGWLETSVDGIETRAQAAVRDTDASIEVLLVWSKGERFCFPPWIEGGREIPYDLWRDAASARAVARLTITLPHVLCAYHRLDAAIAALEERTAEHFLDWQQSPWLKGALILPLDDQGATELCGVRLRYDRDMGLICGDSDETDS